MESFVQIVAGGMHTVCVTNDGRVFSFGCNDEGALGRPSSDVPPEEREEKDKNVVEESRPGPVIFPDSDVKIKMVSGMYVRQQFAIRIMCGAYAHSLCILHHTKSNVLPQQANHLKHYNIYLCV